MRRILFLDELSNTGFLIPYTCLEFFFYNYVIAFYNVNLFVVPQDGGQSLLSRSRLDYFPFGRDVADVR